MPIIDDKWNNSQWLWQPDVPRDSAVEEVIT